MKVLSAKKIIAFSLAITCICSGILALTTINSTSYAMKSNLKSLMNGIDECIKDKSELSYSSNPYEYIEDNENYDNIVKLGVKVLPLLKDDLESGKAGLKEYIEACAIQDITGIDVSKLEGEWSNAREFSQKYDILLNNVGGYINAVLNSENTSALEKTKMIKDYGVLAVPYLKEEGRSEDSDIIEEAIKQIEGEYISKTKARKLSEIDLKDLREMVIG